MRTCVHVCDCVCTHISWTGRNPWGLTFPMPGVDTRGLQRDYEVFQRDITPVMVTTLSSLGVAVRDQPVPSLAHAASASRRPLNNPESREWSGGLLDGAWNTGVTLRDQNSDSQRGEPALTPRPLQEEPVHWQVQATSPLH